jgi:hypothetical protein
MQIRTLALQELSKTEMITTDKILLARECKVASWLLSGYDDILRRPHAIPVADLEVLGWETAAKLLQIREQDIMQYIGSRPVSTCCSTCKSYVQLPSPHAKIVSMRQAHNHIAQLRDVFDAELKGMDNVTFQQGVC